MRRLLSPVGFTLLGLCFLMPFMAASVQDEGSRLVLEWRGGVLSVGGTATEHAELLLWDERRRGYVMRDVSGEVADEPLLPWTRVPAQPAFMAAVVAVVAGVLAGVPVLARSRVVMAVAAGAATVVALAVGGWLAVRGIKPYAEASGMAVALAYGWWLAIGAASALTLANAVAAHLLTRAARRSSPVRTSSPPRSAHSRSA